MTGTVTRHRLVVRGWPARRNRDHNAFQSLLSDALEQVDPRITVEEFVPRRPWQRADVWHWHWPDSLLNGSTPSAAAKVLYMLTLVRIAHWRNIPIVWTAHNSVSHARRHPRLERLLWAEFVDRVAAVHYLSESSRLEISRHWPRLKTVPAIVTKHGAYPVARPVPGPKVPEGAFVVAFVGKISHYKGVPDLVAAFDALRGSDVHLLVAGALNPELGDWLERRNRDDTRETWITHLLTEPELAGVYEVADLVVFPYRAVTNSGSVIYALSAGKRVLAPALGSIPEVAATVGPLWLMTYEGKISSKTLEAAICRVRDTPKVDGPDLQAFQWNEIAEAVANFYWKISRRGVG